MITSSRYYMVNSDAGDILITKGEADSKHDYADN